ncbi:superoxide dismutase family protein [Nitrospira sp. BLG_2]|uniref:superoxide dismutase family protein n=1 Tax=Nitrospira sp. BLG_2 TaxID=3397507 RepID=UPI003B9C90DD
MTKTILTIMGINLMLSAVGNALATNNAKAIFKDTKGKQVGTATLIQTPNGVLIDADLSSLPPGEHAFHIHQTGRCDAADGFKSAGSHYALKKREHGFKVENGPHEGDMPNQFAGADGTLRLHVFNPAVSLLQGDGALVGGSGTALVVHAKADDYRSQPAGDAGDRIACAVIERAGE